MNSVVYRRGGNAKRPCVRLFVSESEFGRDISVLIKGAQARTSTFPNTVREVRSEAFAENECLKSVVLNEGLERLEGPRDD